MNTMEILNSFPEPEGKILRNIDKQKCELAVEQIIQGGKKTLTEIVNLILEPGKGQDIRARHAVHATAIRVGGPGKEKIDFRWSGDRKLKVLGGFSSFWAGLE